MEWVMKTTNDHFDECEMKMIKNDLKLRNFKENEWRLCKFSLKMDENHDEFSWKMTEITWVFMENGWKS